MDFSYNSYKVLLEKIRDIGYGFIPILNEGRDYLNEKTCYLRHDVDSDFLGCVPLAKIEESLGIKSTWFFLYTSDTYNILSKEIIGIMDTLDKMGHCVGFHVDATLYDSKEEMENEICELYSILSKKIHLSKTISFHRPSSWILDGHCEVDGWTNAYESKYFKECIYISDSNRRKFWEENRLPKVMSGEATTVCLLFHPIWWHSKDYDADTVFRMAGKYLGKEHVENSLIDCCKQYSTFEKRNTRC